MCSRFLPEAHECGEGAGLPESDGVAGKHLGGVRDIPGGRLGDALCPGHNALGAVKGLGEYDGAAKRPNIDVAQSRDQGLCRRSRDGAGYPFLVRQRIGEGGVERLSYEGGVAVRCCRSSRQTGVKVLVCLCTGRASSVCCERVGWRGKQTGNMN